MYFIAFIINDHIFQEIHGLDIDPPPLPTHDDINGIELKVSV